LSFPEDVESSLVELGINVRDYRGYREAQLAEVIPLFRTMYFPEKAGLAA
jgi:hypothetical protein